MVKLIDELHEQPRGLIDENESLQQFSLHTYDAPENLAHLVVSAWHVQWDLPSGESYLQSNVPHPVQHIVLDPTLGSGLYGCVTQRFDYELHGTGQVLGFKLRPGMGRAFFDAGLSSITDRFLPLHNLIGTERAESLEHGLSQGMPLEDLLKALSSHVAMSAGEINQSMKRAQAAVELMEDCKEVCRVSDIADRLGISTRQIQRLFSSYIGVSPKWVIDRYRILDAVDEMNTDEHVDIAELAQKLGYSDQSHFSNKFKEITGFSPSSYQKRQLCGVPTPAGAKTE